jgi:hypothetical protein
VLWQIGKQSKLILITCLVSKHSRNTTLSDLASLNQVLTLLHLNWLIMLLMADTTWTGNFKLGTGVSKEAPKITSRE